MRGGSYEVWRGEGGGAGALPAKGNWQSESAQERRPPEAAAQERRPPCGRIVVAEQRTVTSPSGVRPKVSIYVPVRDYGRYLRQCLASVLDQSFSSWELLVIDDGSHDESAAIALEFQQRDPRRVSVLTHAESKGLRACANVALERALGEYIMRLDADDYLDASALLVLSDYLDRHPDIGLVYPNWIYVRETGEILGVEIRKRIEADADVRDLPAHGACTMVRRRVLKAIGGYDPQFTAQDGHELWMKALHRFRVGNVQTPLFFYRRHDESMSNDLDRLLESRRQIKRAVATGYSGPVSPRIAVIVPVKNHYPGIPNLAFEPFAGRPLIDYTLEQAAALPGVECVLVSTDDDGVIEHCAAFSAVSIHRRDPALSDPMARLDQVIVDAVGHLESVRKCFADIIVILSVHTPLRRLEHVREALDTLLVYDVDQVLSTYEDLDLHFRHGRQGLHAINAGAMATVRYEREALFVANGSIDVLWRDFIGSDGLHAGRIGHIVMSRLESLQAKNADDRKLLRWLMSESAVVPMATAEHLACPKQA